MGHKLFRFVVVLISVASIASCGGSQATEGNEPDEGESSTETESTALFNIAMTDNVFAPATFTAKVGQEVEFVLDNQGVAIHNMIVEGTDFKSDLMINPGVTSSFKANFTKAGVYRLICVYHQPAMSAEIVVED